MVLPDEGEMKHILGSHLREMRQVLQKWAGEQGLIVDNDLRSEIDDLMDELVPLAAKWGAQRYVARLSRRLWDAEEWDNWDDWDSDPLWLGA